ncbi:RtcB family protein [uncultured Adlercreutzia sp.]|uniref:RtcB family protein n=1 Tax=uncultured Adlercreutzia sp. TaxID=875803 RepID=UPI0026009C41|nr:RtcB family protein [uncultured Adlercreutzia sp.]
MQLVEGAYASAHVYSDDAEQYALAQVKMICDNPAAAGSRICVMPDVHPGKMGPVGLTMTVGDCVLPGLVGVDIGCGVTVAKVRAKRLELPKVDAVVRDRVPAGFSSRTQAHRFFDDVDLDELACAKSVRRDKAALSLGTLGGGNHFIEVDKGEDGSLYVAVHSGSRHLGVEVAEHYLRRGQEALRARGEDVPYEMTYLDGELLAGYLHDMGVVCEYAALNRRAMIDELTRGLKWKVEEVVESVHNYIDTAAERPMLRKGAIAAAADERVVVPLNMRDGIIMGRGLGNEAWNGSAPHGAGRRFSRDEVKNHYTVSSFKAAMKGVYSSCIDKGTLDESPFAYRDAKVIQTAIGETVEVDEVLQPLYSFKAGNAKG